MYILQKIFKYIRISVIFWKYNIQITFFGPVDSSSILNTPLDTKVISRCWLMCRDYINFSFRRQPISVKYYFQGVTAKSLFWLYQTQKTFWKGLYPRSIGQKLFISASFHAPPSFHSVCAGYIPIPSPICPFIIGVCDCSGTRHPSWLFCKSPSG